MDEILAKRYADAFMKYAHDSIGLEKAIDDFKNIKIVLNGNPELIELLKAPEISSFEKNEIIDHLPGDYFTQEFRHFLKLLLKKGRIDKLNDIVEYIRVNYSFAGKTQVLLKASYPVDPDFFPRILQKFKDKFGKDIKLYFDLDGSLLGGLKAVMGNTVIDASIRRRLEDLRKNLQELKVA